MIQLFMLAVLLTPPQGRTQLNLSQVLAWRDVYDFALDKNVALAIERWGNPDHATSGLSTWEPSPRTGNRKILAATGPDGIVRHVTVLPQASETMSVFEVLGTPEAFIFESGRLKSGSYFAAETRNRQVRLVFSCSSAHEPEFYYVVLKSTASPDDVPL